MRSSSYCVPTYSVLHNTHTLPTEYLIHKTLPLPTIASSPNPNLGDSYSILYYLTLPFSFLPLLPPYLVLSNLTRAIIRPRDLATSTKTSEQATTDRSPLYDPTLQCSVQATRYTLHPLCDPLHSHHILLTSHHTSHLTPYSTTVLPYHPLPHLGDGRLALTRAPGRYFPRLRLRARLHEQPPRPRINSVSITHSHPSRHVVRSTFGAGPCGPSRPRHLCLHPRRSRNRPSSSPPIRRGERAGAFIPIQRITSRVQDASPTGQA